MNPNVLKAWLFFLGLYLLHHNDSCVTLATLSRESQYTEDTKMNKNKTVAQSLQTKTVMNDIMKKHKEYE